MLKRLIAQTVRLLTVTMPCSRCGQRDTTVQRWIVGSSTTKNSDPGQPLCGPCVQRALERGEHVEYPTVFPLP
jgi:hypothetical protein